MWRLSHCHSNTNFNPRSPHGERLLILSICTPPVVISIHAPRTGSDFQGGACRYWFWHFNPRSPHGERRSFHFLLHDFDKHFNPRSPHGERRPQTSPCKGGWDFNPRSPHGERQVKARAVNQSKDISIHAPRTGSDQRGEDRHYYIRHFNPRSPHGERPYIVNRI